MHVPTVTIILEECLVGGSTGLAGAAIIDNGKTNTGDPCLNGEHANHGVGDLIDDECCTPN